MRTIAKPRPYLLDKADRDADWKKLDEAENKKARLRAKGRCEVTVAGVRCGRRDSQTHHQIGGWKRRGRGASALAENKTRCCSGCHPLITGNVLEHLEGNRYRRIE